MSKCSECGGSVVATEHLVYRSDGTTSGEYSCQDCGRVKKWSIKGRGEEVINMRDDK